MRRLSRNPSTARGFTLLETMLALVIVSWGILAFVDAQTAFYRSNTWSSQAATGMLLANELREMTRRLPRHDETNGLTAAGFGREAGEITINDLDDIDDFDGISFGLGGTFNGPVDAFREIVPEVDNQGNPVLTAGVPDALLGWTQRVLVTKVDPYNFAGTHPDDYEQIATASLPAIPADAFPLRVTVIVEYQGLSDAVAREITRISWIAPVQD